MLKTLLSPSKNFILNHYPMKNSTKLILANVFALLAVVSILSVSNALGLSIMATPSLLISLIFIPQIGFFYFYWKSLTETAKGLA